MRYILAIAFVLLAVSCAEEKKENIKETNQYDSLASNFPKDTVLNFSNNSIAYKPDSIAYYKNVRVINLSGHPELNFNDEFEELSKLPRLEVLILKKNNLKEIPINIGMLENLKELDISANAIASIPIDIKYLKKLEKINLSYNNINSFPNELTELTNLKILKASDNYIKFISDSISNLTLLEKIDLSKNEISILSPKICSLIELKWLNLSNNLIAELPANIGSLRNLNYLDLSKNELEDLPPTMVKLGKQPLNLFLEKNLFDEMDIEDIKNMLPNTAIEF